MKPGVKRVRHAQPTLAMMLLAAVLASCGSEPASAIQTRVPGSAALAAPTSAAAILNPLATQHYDLIAYFDGLRFHLTAVQMQATQASQNEVTATFDVSNTGLRPTTDNLEFILRTGTSSDMVGVTSGSDKVPVGGATLNLGVSFALAPTQTLDLNTGAIVIDDYHHSAEAVVPLAPGSPQPRGLVDNAPTRQSVSGTLKAGPDTLRLDSVTVGASNSDLNQQAHAQDVIIELVVSGSTTSELGINSLQETLTLSDGSTVDAQWTGSPSTPWCCLNGFPHDGTQAAGYFYFTTAGTQGRLPDPSRAKGALTFTYTRDGQAGSANFTVGS